MTEKVLLKHFAHKYLREKTLPSFTCPGCGLGIVTNCFLKAVEDLGHKDLSDFAFCSGIGCSAWIPSPYFKADTLHTLHGRAVPVALGVKLMKPDLHVVVFGGDGDLASIGLGHLIHAARRNLEITVIMVNNFVYGMTGGQVSPTTPEGVYTKSTPYGNVESPFDVAQTVKAAGAGYVARWTTFHVMQLKESIKAALQKDGFGFIEVISQCPTQYGRRVGLKTPVEMLKWFQKNSVTIKKSQTMDPKQLKGKIVVGVFADIKKPGLVNSYHGMIKRLKEKRL